MRWRARCRLAGAACAAVVLTALAPGPAGAATTDDLVFIHHSCGQNWLDNSLDAALLAKDYIDERNDIYYGTDFPPDDGRPDSLAATPGDNTDMDHWVRWFNDYLGRVKAHGCADGVNKIIMFKSCYPASNIASDGTEPGDPFSDTKSVVNYKAVFRHPAGPGNAYTHGGATYKPLGDVFAENPNTLFIFVTAPPRHYAPTDATNDAEAHRARLFNNWAKGDWLTSYNAAHPGLNNVAVFDWFDVLAYPDDHATHPSRLKQEYGGAGGDSHPNATANGDSTAAFATNPDSFIDKAHATSQATIERVSVASDGTQGEWEGNENYSSGPNCDISSDGRFVVFQTLAANLVPGDSNGLSDVFVRDRTAGNTERVSVSSGGAESDVDGPAYPRISADGRFVAFHERQVRRVRLRPRQRHDRAGERGVGRFGGQRAQRQPLVEFGRPVRGVRFLCLQSSGRRHQRPRRRVRVRPADQDDRAG